MVNGCYYFVNRVALMIYKPTNAMVVPRFACTVGSDPVTMIWDTFHCQEPLIDDLPSMVISVSFTFVIPVYLSAASVLLYTSDTQIYRYFLWPLYALS